MRSRFQHRGRCLGSTFAAAKVRRHAGGGLRDTESELPSDNNRDCNVACFGDNLDRRRRFVQVGGESIGVQNQVLSSGSICSNSSSMSFLYSRSFLVKIFQL